MGCEKLSVNDVDVFAGLAIATEETDVRVKLLVARPAIKSPTKTTPALSPEPTLILTVAGEAEHGGMAPVWTADMMLPGATPVVKPGVQTAVWAWAGTNNVIEAMPLTAAKPRKFSDDLLE